VHDGELGFEFDECRVLTAWSRRDRGYVQPQSIRAGAGDDYSAQSHSGPFMIQLIALITRRVVKIE